MDKFDEPQTKLNVELDLHKDNPIENDCDTLLKIGENAELNLNQTEEVLEKDELMTGIEESTEEDEENTENNNNIRNTSPAKLECIIENVKQNEDNYQLAGTESLEDLLIKNEHTLKNGLSTNETIHSTNDVHRHEDVSLNTKRKSRPRITIFNCNFCGIYSTSKREHVNHLRIHQIRTENFRHIRMLKELRDKVADGTICFSKQLYIDLSKSTYLANDSEIYKCTFCDHISNDLYHLKRHIKVHFKVKKTYDCSICFKSFTRQDHHRSHVNAHRRANDENKYKCKICHAGFRCKTFWEKHIVSHGIKFKCTVCNCKFSNSYSLKIHKRIHSGILYRCELCLKDFITEQYLANHMKRHSRKPEDRKFECHICSKKFFAKFMVAQHVKTHFLTPSHKCHVCSKLFTLKSYLNMHMKYHVAEGKDKCLDCSKTFMSHLSLKRHKTLHSAERVFKCNYCEKSYSEMTTLKKHIKRHTGEAIYKCPICGQHFMSAYNLKKHTDVCRPFECKICHKKFNQQSQLKVHLLRHEGEKNFQCQICDKKFLLRHALKQHLIIHTDLKPFKCQQCSKAFNVKHNLTLHVRTHENKKVPCTVCSKLLSKGSLKRHMLSHSEERRFKCPICTKSFIQKTHLEYHLTNHTGEKGHQCPDCPKAFVTIHKLKRHQKSHEKHTKKLESKIDNWKRKFECPDCPKVFSHPYKLKRHRAWGHVKI